MPAGDDHLARALGRKPPPDGPLTVHRLEGGMTRCSLRGTPSTWPANHKYVAFNDTELLHEINCEGCLTPAWFFTFGSGHTYPGTNEPCERAFVRIEGSYYEARAKMVSVFGIKWSHQYPSAEAAGVDQFGLTELDVDFSDFVHPAAPTIDDIVPEELHGEYCNDVTVSTCFNMALANRGESSAQELRQQALIQIAQIGADQRRSMLEAYSKATREARSLFSTADFVALAQAVLAWRLQGSIQRWTTPASVALARHADELHARYPELVTEDVKALARLKTGDRLPSLEPEPYCQTCGNTLARTAGPGKGESGWTCLQCDEQPSD